MIAATPSLSRMSSRMVTAGLSELLAGNPPITVFAVQNDAFDGAENILAHLSPTGVENMLLAHVAFDT